MSYVTLKNYIVFVCIKFKKYRSEKGLVPKRDISYFGKMYDDHHNYAD